MTDARPETTAHRKCDCGAIRHAQNLSYVYDDGGRKVAGGRGKAGDCVVRAIAIALQLPYAQVWDELSAFGRKTFHLPNDPLCYRPYLEAKGWKWVTTSGIGEGTKVHLNKTELPRGRIIARVSRHLCAVIDGVIHDTYNPSRSNSRCVYGYFKLDGE